MTGWDPCGDIDTHADAAHEAADRERKRERENRPVKSALTCRCVMCKYVKEFSPIPPDIPMCPRCYSPMVAESAAVGIRQANERAADAEHTNERGDK